MRNEGDTDWYQLRNKRIQLDDHECVNCGATGMLQVHHIVPKAAGGQDELSNLRTLCYECHEKSHPDVNFSVEHVNPTSTSWTPTVETARTLVSKCGHPVDKLVILLLAKTGLGVEEIVNIDVTDIYLRAGKSELTSTIGPRKFPFILVETNEIGAGSGNSKRLCDTQVPLDKEMRAELNRYLAIRPDSDSKQLLISTTSWGDEITKDVIHHKVERNARDIGLYEHERGATDNLTPHKLIQMFKLRFDGQPATRDYLTGRKEQPPYPWPNLATDYKEGIFQLTV
ncbi:MULTISPECIES: HNH endonuclease [Salinibaculum]|uniref:HNH endonuclease n=1 Tax=Salinibaculum TaxID=2732368 RepID=UPI0030CF4134